MSTNSKHYFRANLLLLPLLLSGCGGGGMVYEDHVAQIKDQLQGKEKTEQIAALRELQALSYVAPDIGRLVLDLFKKSKDREVRVLALQTLPLCRGESEEFRQEVLKLWELEPDTELKGLLNVAFYRLAETR